MFIKENSSSKTYSINDFIALKLLYSWLRYSVIIYRNVTKASFVTSIYSRAYSFQDS